MAGIIDCFTFNNELDILEMRLTEISGLVSRFVLVEADRNFRGDPKPLCFDLNRERFRPWLDRIEHIVVRDLPVEAKTPWVREYHQRNAIMRGLSGGHPDDVVLVSDVDEIPNVQSIERAAELLAREPAIVCFRQAVYYNKLNWRVQQDWFGTRALSRRYLRYPQATRFAKVRKKKPTTQLVERARWVATSSWQYGWPLRRIAIEDAGWHMSYIGDADNARRKIKSFSHDELDVPELVGAGIIEKRLEQGLTVLGNKPDVVPLAEMPQLVRSQHERFRAVLDLQGAKSTRP